jgi:hypothetical protein
MDGKDAVLLLAKHCNHEGISLMDGIVKKILLPLAFGSKARPIGCKYICTVSIHGGVWLDYWFFGYVSAVVGSTCLGIWLTRYCQEE